MKPIVVLGERLAARCLQTSAGRLTAGRRAAGFMMATLCLLVACERTTSDIFMESPYRGAIEANPVLRQAGGGMIVTRMIGPPLVIGVGATIIPAGLSLDACGAQVKQATFRAYTAAASANAPLHVMQETSTGDFAEVTVVNGEERGEVIEKTTQITTQGFEGFVRRLRPVGRWRGKMGEKEAVFVAVGGVVAADSFGSPARSAQ